MSSQQQQTRYTVHFAGHVQGVGFRYTTINIARHYQIAGYVQNLPDGKVLVVAEGLTKELDNFIDSILEAMQYHISQHTTDKTPATGEFGSPSQISQFQIRYY